MDLFGRDPERAATAAPVEPRAEPADRSRALDQFYTVPAVARSCMDMVLTHLAAQGPATVGTWLEPSAGAGAFLDLMPAPRRGFDLDPACDGVEEVDFLKWIADPMREVLPGPVVTVGNPPFGRNASLALRFVNAAASISDLVCMILPRTFEKASMQAKVVRTHGLALGVTLGSDAFTHAGRPYDVPCCFQIWRALPITEPRRIGRAALTHPDFAFVENQGMDRADAERLGIDFAFQRVGGGAGTCSVEGLSKSWKSHYWIRADRSRVDPADLMRALAGIDWDRHRHSTAGNPSIGKGEIVLEYARIRPDETAERGPLL